MFTTLNAPFFEGAPYLAHLILEFQPAYPYVRQTNGWVGYFGKYPEFCARITTEPQIETIIERGRRHVAKIPIDTSSRSIAQRETMDKVGSIVAQLEKFGLKWEKTAGKITVTGFTENETDASNEISLEFFVCDDTGDFHVLASKPAMFFDGEIFQPDMNDNKLNQLIFCIRLLFMNRDPADEFPILTRNLWDMAVHLTLTPDFDRVEFHPEWMDDANPDWFLPEPEILEPELPEPENLHDLWDPQNLWDFMDPEPENSQDVWDPQNLWDFMDPEPFDERFLFYA